MIKLDALKIKKNIEAGIGDDIASGRVGGAVVCVMQNGEVLYKNCFGKAGENRELREDAIFRLASMTKPVTGVAILKQIQKGLVSLDDPICKFIPGYEEMEIGGFDENKQIFIKEKAKKQVTVLHLLTHSSGIGSGELGNLIGAKLPKEACCDLAHVTAAYAEQPIEFEPYEASAYSPLLGFDLLARIVEITSEMPYDEYLKKEIFEPLGMHDTGFTPTAEQWGRMVEFHNYMDGKPVFYPVDRKHIFGDNPLTYFCGGAGLFSTLSDYMKFANMLVRGGKTESGEQLIDADLIKQMGTPAVPEAIMPGAQRWGLSVRVITDESYKRLPVDTFGWSGAYGTHFWVDPVNGVTAVYMKNSLYDGGSGARTAWEFEGDVYGTK